MSRICAIGAREQLRCFTLAGVDVLDGGDDEAAQTAWGALPADVGFVILTAEARVALTPEHLEQRLWVVLPA